MTLESELRNYRWKHSENVRRRAWWLRLMDGQRTRMVRRYDAAAAFCRAEVHKLAAQIREQRYES